MSTPRARLSTPSLITIVAVWSVWLAAMSAGDRWGLFADNAFMSVTMAFGSFVAGATSEGGGAVAFPVMTLFFDIDPGVARDFSLMIQAVGMTSAAIAILAGGIAVERRAILWGTLGGTIGLVGGLEFVAGHMPAEYTKMFFTSTWASFAVALFLVNRYHDREVHERITNFLPRHAVLLLSVGVLGGVISSITGSGLDITLFALLVLRLRINEKVATPTSVVLMGINAALGFLWKGGVQGDLAPAAWSYWWVCVPIVVLGAPLGAWFIERRSRLFVAGLLYVAISAQTVLALVTVPLTPALAAFCLVVLASGAVLFRAMANRGVRRLEWLTERERVPDATA